jgi:predicted DNA-binding protein (MmcQ/YjbR family)
VEVGRTTRQELINHCLSFPAVYEDYPFDDITDAGAWTVMRHKTNKKSFALIYERNGKLCVNLKCDPLEADLLRQAFKGVTPAYHMNKEHWNTVIIGGDVPEGELFRQIENSYDLVKPKARKRRENL